MNLKLYQKVSVEGAELATDVYLPDGPGPFPILLLRTPYHRAGSAGSAVRHVEAGYGFVVQDTRGKFGSTGRFRPVLDEAADGRATIDWIANQGWCNGRIGLIGGSYPGIVQIPAAAGGHEALRCMSPAVAPHAFFNDWLRYDGCFALANAVRWGMTIASCPSRLAEANIDWRALWAQKTVDGVFEHLGCRSDALAECLDHDREDDYWRAIDQREMYADVTVPGLHTAGWFDHISRGEYDAYAGLRDGAATAVARTNQRLRIGPWGHTSMGKDAYGEREFPGGAMDLQAHELRFLDLWMKDIDDGLTDEPPVRLFVMGANRWMGFPDWPPPEAQTRAWHLRAAGGLSRGTPGAEAPDTYRYDPADPAPTTGGPIYWGMGDDVPAGPADQARLLARSDVLSYRSDPLPGPVTVIGEVEVELWVATSAADTDFIAKLCVEQPDGRVISLATGSLRCRYRNDWRKCDPMPPGEPVEIRLRLSQLAYEFAAGSRIALLVTSSSYPRILPHPNTMAPTWREPSPVVAENQVLHDPEHPSRLLLPIVGL